MPDETLVPPALVLLDHRLSHADGGASAQSILDLVPDTAVLLMSASEAATVLAEALDAGVSGFVHKSRSADAVLQAVRAVATGETAFEPEDLRLGRPSRGSGVGWPTTRSS